MILKNAALIVFLLFMIIHCDVYNAESIFTVDYFLITIRATLFKIMN